MTILTPNRERFLNAILREVPAEQIAEIHFFQPIKQGGVESGVAVVASVERGASGEEDNETPELAQDDDLPEARRSTLDARRHTVYTARYRLTLKGLDRGKWESSVFAEADAPLITVDAVVRGVQRRSGDVDAPDRLMGDEIRALAPAAAATAPTGRP